MPTIEASFSTLPFPQRRSEKARLPLRKVGCGDGGSPRMEESGKSRGHIGRRLPGQEVPAGAELGRCPLSCRCLQVALAAGPPPSTHCALSSVRPQSSTPEIRAQSHCKARSHQVWKAVGGHLQDEADHREKSCWGAPSRQELVQRSLKMPPIHRLKGGQAASGT